MPHPMPNTIGTGGTRGTLWRGATNFGGTWSFGAQHEGFPFKGDRSPSFMARPSTWSVGQAGRAGGLAAWVSARGFLPTRCRSLVRGIRLALFRAGDVESNPGPDGGPCVGCGLLPAANTRALLRCKEGCGRECHHKEACSGLRRGEQRQGILACGVCVVVSRGWLPPSPNLVKCRLRWHLANHLVNQGPYLVNWDPTVRPNCTTLRTESLLWGVLYRQVRLSPPLGEGVGLVLLPQTLGMAGVGGGDAGPGGGPGVGVGVSPP
jgi:hypothetical protein